MRNARKNKNTFREIISTLCVLKFEIKNHGAMKASKTQYQDSKTSWGHSKNKLTKFGRFFTTYLPLKLTFVAFNVNKKVQFCGPTTQTPLVNLVFE